MNTTLLFWEGEGISEMPPLHWTRWGKGIWCKDSNGHPVHLNREPEGWSISPEGKVTPSIHCQTLMGPNAAKDSNYYATTERICDWHVFATLEGYSDG